MLLPWIFDAPGGTTGPVQFYLGALGDHADYGGSALRRCSMLNACSAVSLVPMASNE